MLRSTPWVGLGVLVLLLAGCSQGTTRSHDQPDPDPTTGEIPLGPDWSFTDTQGSPRGRDEAMGAPSGIFFMATWCSKCQSLAPRLGNVVADYEAQGFQMHTVSWDPQEDADDLRSWKSRYAHDWPHGVDAGSKIAQTFEITSQSSIVILDARGNPVKSWIYDVPSESALRSAIDEAYERSSAT